MANETRYFAIFRNDLTLKEYDSLQKIDSVIYWVKRTDTGGRWTTASGNTFNIYEYHISDVNLVDTTIEIGGWKILSIYENSMKHSYSRTRFKIADRNGRVESMQFYPEWHSNHFVYDEKAIVHVIKFLQETKEMGFDCWHSVYLFHENKKLKEENERLQETIDTLRKRL